MSTYSTRLKLDFSFRTPAKLFGRSFWKRMRSLWQFFYNFERDDEKKIWASLKSSTTTMIFCRNVDCIRSSSTSSELPEKSHGATTQKWIKNISASMFLIQNLTFFSSPNTNHLLMGYKIILKKLVPELGKKIKIVACHDSYDQLENELLHKWEIIKSSVHVSSFST